ncbi:hypothetical protein BELL_0712g00050 [Botrytis elliptica]|uniref:Uncharacterized protein n=1 Tax=Botrytis elliptica TaxID=278938 RepID=A0A4Z1J9X9_9HELO|nr:hypothetical protein BELL_0712g00050 [Botrytis elliptica]
MSGYQEQCNYSTNSSEPHAAIAHRDERPPPGTVKIPSGSSIASNAYVTVSLREDSSGVSSSFSLFFCFVALFDG